MSFFSRSAPAPPPPAAAPAQIPSGAQQQQQAINVSMALLEMEGTVDLVNQMQSTCFNKCIAKFNNGDLQIGELACIDRCAIMYMQASTVVGQVYGKHAEAMAAAAAAQSGGLGQQIGGQQG